MFTRLYTLVLAGLTLQASGRTLKHGLSARRLPLLARVCYTLLVIASKMRPNGKITINGESYDLREYMAPKNFVALVLAAKLYLTRDSIGYSDFVYEFKMPDNFTFDDVAFTIDEQGFEIVTEPEQDKLEAHVFTDKDLLTPAQFNQFFKLFNDNQRGDSFPALSTTEINISVYLTVNDCCGLASKNDDCYYVKVNEAGTVHENVALILGFKSLLDDRYLPTYKASNNEELAKWLTLTE